MALVKFGAGIIQMSGSIAGTTFARNRSGNYARARTKPINPSSSGQQAVRNAMAGMVEYWSQTATQVQRTAWDLYASSVEMLNKFGETIHLSGMNHFVRANSILSRAAAPIVADGPTIFELPSGDGLFTAEASAATQLVSVTFSEDGGWEAEDNGFLHVFVGSPQNPTVNFFAGPWKLGDNIAGAVIPITSPQTFTSPFVLTEDQKVWVYARIQRADGRLSNPFRDDFIVGA